MVVYRLARLLREALVTLLLLPGVTAVVGRAGLWPSLVWSVLIFDVV